MRTMSRQLRPGPPTPTPLPFHSAFVLAMAPIWLAFMVLLLALTGAGLLADYVFGWTRRAKAERSSDSICSFARAFDLRQIDSRIVRATYEYYTAAFGYPAHTTDRVDEEWFDIEGLPDIAFRCWRSLDGCERNPISIETVGDMVRFLNQQPRIAPTAA